jgi:dynein intermediate chain 2
MFERETSREKNLEKAAKEAKIKARKEAGKGNDVVERKMTEADLQQVNLHLPSSAGQGH